MPKIKVNCDGSEEVSVLYATGDGRLVNFFAVCRIMFFIVVQKIVVEFVTRRFFRLLYRLDDHRLVSDIHNCLCRVCDWPVDDIMR